MPELAVPHPGDASRLVRVDDLLAELWARTVAAAATDKLQTDTLTDHEVQFKVQGEALAAAVSRIDAQQASITALTSRVAKLEKDTRVADLTTELDALEERVAALEAESGPALGVDVSKYQTTEQAAAALAGEPDFCIINATTGLFTVSSALSSHTANSRKVANITGFYHWSQTVNSSATTPDKSDPIGEAKHFLTDGKPLPGDVVALDHEEALGTWAQRVAYAITWLDEVRRRTGALPMLYINGDWLYNLWTTATAEQRARLFAYPVWFARPTGTPGDYGTTAKYRPETYPGVRVLVHQYSIDVGIDRNWTPDISALRATAVQYLIP